jgi:5'-nucleotidase/UDP-sugar diphosphatase
MRTPFVLIALAALLAGCATPPAERPPLLLTILHTNDHHGRFWPNADGEYGMAARMTAIARVRAEVAAAGGQVLLLHGGDINTGVPESSLQDAEPDFIGMNLLGYDASAVGNHEFDKSPAVQAKQRAWSQFALISANIYKADGQRVYPPYVILNRGGYRIAVLGLTTDDTAKLSLPDNVAGLEFRKPADEAAKLLPELHAKADIVIATTHMGHYPDGRRGVNAPGDVEMARSLPAGNTGGSQAGLNLIVGGHSHDPVCMLRENVRNEAYTPGSPCWPDQQNGTWIVQANEWGKYLGRADFEVRDGQMKLLKYELIPINLVQRLPDGSKRPASAAIPEDPAVRAALLPFQQRGQLALNVPVGEAIGVFDGDRARIRQQPTNLGSMLARAMLEKTGADLAVMNSGGIRDSLPAGRLTFRDLLKVQPFGNELAVVRMKGSELFTWLAAAAAMTPGAGGYPQTAGVQMRIEAGVLKEARVQGRPIDPLADYRLAINHFTATGGDGFPVLQQHPGYINTGFVDADVLRDYIAARSPIKAADYTPGDDVQRK